MRRALLPLLALAGLLSASAPAPAAVSSKTAPAKAPAPPQVTVRLVPATVRQGDTVLILVAGTRGVLPHIPGSKRPRSEMDITALCEGASSGSIPDEGIGV